jgi:hypothetical protein
MERSSPLAALVALEQLGREPAVAVPRHAELQLADPGDRGAWGVPPPGSQDASRRAARCNIQCSERKLRSGDRLSTRQTRGELLSGGGPAITARSYAFARVWTRREARHYIEGTGRYPI